MKLDTSIRTAQRMLNWRTVSSKLSERVTFGPEQSVGLSWTHSHRNSRCRTVESSLGCRCLRYGHWGACRLACCEAWFTGATRKVATRGPASRLSTCRSSSFRRGRCHLGSDTGSGEGSSPWTNGKKDIWWAENEIDGKRESIDGTVRGPEGNDLG